MPHSQHGEDASATAAGSQIPVTLVADSLEKPSLDDRDYRVVRLDNELEALLVHDPETDKASAALDVNVGNFSDESDIPGMAHAVEHVSKSSPGVLYRQLANLLPCCSFFSWAQRSFPLRTNMANISPPIQEAPTLTPDQPRRTTSSIFLPSQTTTRILQTQTRPRYVKL